MKTPFSSEDQFLSNATVEDETTVAVASRFVLPKYSYLYLPLIFSVVVVLGGALLGFSIIRLLESLTVVREHPIIFLFGFVSVASALLLIKRRYY